MLAASQLTAFQAMYKAAAKRYGVAPFKPLLETIDAKLLEVKALDKVRVGKRGGGGAQRMGLQHVAMWRWAWSLQCSAVQWTRTSSRAATELMQGWVVQRVGACGQAVRGTRCVACRPGQGSLQQAWPVVAQLRQCRVQRAAWPGLMGPRRAGCMHVGAITGGGGGGRCMQRVPVRGMPAVDASGPTAHGGQLVGPDGCDGR